MPLSFPIKALVQVHATPYRYSTYGPHNELNLGIVSQRRVEAKAG